MLKGAWSQLQLGYHQSTARKLGASVVCWLVRLRGLVCLQQRSGKRSANTTPESLTHKKALKPRILSSDESPLKINSKQVSWSTTSSSPHCKSLSFTVSSLQSHGKVKVKTRPTNPIVELEDEAPGAESMPAVGDTVAGNRISVCAASMDIFRRMFVSYGKHSNSNLRWGEFVRAMEDAGFPSTASSGGSAVIFDNSRGSGAIRLHQPHPDPSINPIMLRSFGKRMFKQFGWSIDSFMERV